MKAIEVILFDDNPRVRDALAMLLSGTPGIHFVHAFADCSQLVKKIKDTHPDVV